MEGIAGPTASLEIVASTTKIHVNIRQLLQPLGKELLNQRRPSYREWQRGREACLLRECIHTHAAYHGCTRTCQGIAATTRSYHSPRNVRRCVLLKVVLGENLQSSISL